MTEFDYDVKSRKALIPSARRKKNGIKSKKCTLPMDYMTKGEIKKMNGELTSINLNKPYTLKELSEFPLDLQKEYIENLRQKYHMSIRMFALMGKTSYNTGHRYFVEKLGIKLSRTELKPSRKQRDDFDKFINRRQNDEVEVKNDEVEVEAKVVEEPVVGIELTSCFVPPLSATLKYKGSVRDVCESLIYALGANSNGHFEITFVKDESGKEAE